MPTRDEWRAAIAAADRPVPVAAVTFFRKFTSSSLPCVLGCADGPLRVVKGLRSDRDLARALVADQVVGRLATLLDAPVPEIAVVDVTQALIDAEPELAGLLPGLAHATGWVPDCTDRMGLDYATTAENAPRTALLTVLYSWAGSWTDHQVIYLKADPHTIYSVDHGHFFPAGPTWSVQSLANAPVAAVDGFFSGCGMQDLTIGRARLDTVTPAQIAATVAAPCDAWGVTLEERVEMADYLARRREQLLGVI